MGSNTLGEPYMMAQLKEARAINKQLAELSRRQSLAIDQLTLRRTRRSWRRWSCLCISCELKERG